MWEVCDVPEETPIWTQLESLGHVYPSAGQFTIRLDATGVQALVTFQHAPIQLDESNRAIPVPIIILGAWRIAVTSLRYAAR